MFNIQKYVKKYWFIESLCISNAYTSYTHVTPLVSTSYFYSFTNNVNHLFVFWTYRYYTLIYSLFNNNILPHERVRSYSPTVIQQLYKGGIIPSTTSHICYSPITYRSYRVIFPRCNEIPKDYRFCSYARIDL